MNEKLEKYLVPLANRLFGKQSPYTMPEKRFVIRPVGMILEDLCKIDDSEWANYAFSREPLGGKFDDSQRLNLTQKALECGTEYAEKYISHYGTTAPEALAKKLGLTVDYPQIPQNTERVLFAEFIEPKQIHIYMDGVDKGKKLLGEVGVRSALGENFNITSVLLSHEIFHYVEQTHKKDMWTLNYKIELWAPKPFRNRSTVAVLSEIAAMGFAKKLSGISFSPYVMDAFLVYGYAPEAASELYEEMMTFSGRTPRLPEDGAVVPAKTK